MGGYIHVFHVVIVRALTTFRREEEALIGTGTGGWGGGVIYIYTLISNIGSRGGAGGGANKGSYGARTLFTPTSHRAQLHPSLPVNL